MSKIRFLKVSSGYEAHIRSFYSKHLDLIGKSYEENQRAFFADCFSWADFWKLNLENTGKFDAGEIVFNNEILQKKWAEENELKYDPSNWMKEILMAQIKEFRPEVLFITDIYHYSDWYVDIKKKVPGLKLVMGWDGILWQKPSTFESCDVVLSCVEATVAFYKANGKNAHFFPFGFEKTILNRLGKNQLRHGLTFIGSVVLIPGYHFNRLDILYGLSKKLPVNFHISNFHSGYNPFRKEHISRLIHGKYDLWKKVSRLERFNKGGLFGMDMFNAFHESKFVLNTHGDNPASNAANFRLMEATGAGSCMVTDWKENIGDYFVPGKEVVTYKSVEECAEKVSYLLAHEDERKAIADAGQRRTLTEYSFEKRVLDFVPYLYSLLGKV